MIFKALNWNVGNQSRSEVHTAIEDLIVHADLGVFNEMADQTLPRVNGYARFQPHHIPGLNRNPVMWRNDKFKFINYWYKLIVPSIFVGEAGAGPNKITHKYRLRIKLKDRETGKILNIYPVHAIPSHHIPKRKELHIKHMHGLRPSVRACRLKGQKTLVLGDFNEDFYRDTVAERILPGKSNHTLLDPVSTRGSRAIDAQIGAGIKAAEQRLFAPHGSDHRPLIVTWE